MESPTRLELRYAILFFLVVTFLAVPEMLWGRVYTAVSEIHQYYPWRYVTAGHELGRSFNYNPFQADAIQFFFPADSYLYQWVHNGQLPLWDATTMCGRPFLANGSSAMCYPPKMLLIGLLSFGQAHNLYIFLHLWMTGVMAYLFLRCWVTRPEAAGLGALIWMLNGFQTVHLETKCILSLYPLLAWSLYESEQILRRPRWRPALRLGLALAMITLSCHMQLGLYGYLYLFLYVVARLTRLTWKRARLGFFVVAGVLGLAWSAPQWLPTMELVSRSGRPNLSLQDHLSQNRYFPENLLTLLIPDFLGNPRQQFFLNRISSNLQTPMDLTAHVGLIAAQMALLVIPLWRRRWVQFHGAILLTACLLVTGTPLLNLLYACAPFFSKFILTRFLVFIPLSVACLAALGTQAWLEERVRGRWLWLPLLGSSLVLAWVCWEVQTSSPGFRAWMAFWREQGVLTNYYTNYTPLRSFLELVEGRIREFYTPFNPALMLPLALAALGLGLVRQPTNLRARLVIALAGFELLLFSWSWNPTGEIQQMTRSFPSLERLQTAQRVASLRTGPPPNSLTPYAIRDAGGYDALHPSTYGALYTALEGKLPVGYHLLYLTQTGPDFERWSNVLGLEYIVCDPLTPEKMPRNWEKIEFPELTLYRNPRALARARLVGHWRVAARPRQQFELLAESQFDPLTTVVLDGEPPLTEGDAQGQVKWLVDSPNRVVQDVSCDGPALLVFNDQNYPGWECRVDGLPTPVFTANLCFRAVALKAGAHRVEWLFRSRTFEIGVLLAGLASLAGLAVSWWEGRASKAGQEAPTPKEG